jgi:hypothetical protein
MGKYTAQALEAENAQHLTGSLCPPQQKKGNTITIEELRKEIQRLQDSVRPETSQEEAKQVGFAVVDLYNEISLQKLAIRSKKAVKK